MGLLSILTIVFVVLKLIGVIAWSWLLVLTPLWILIGLWILGLVLFICGWKGVNRLVDREFNRKW